MSFGVTEVDYGSQTAEHFDRFGLRHYAHVYARNRNQIFVDADLAGTVKRLGLVLLSWQRRFYNVEHYHLDVNGRPLEIRSYADGRIKLFLDGEPVYTENVKTVVRHGERYREVAVWTDPAPDDEENRRRAEQERQARLDAVRARLGGVKEPTSMGNQQTTTEENDHGDDTREEDTPGGTGQGPAATAAGEGFTPGAQG